MMPVATISAAQIRAARGLLGWRLKNLAGHCGVSEGSISDVESGRHQPRKSTMVAIRACFAAHGVEFIDHGVRLLPKNGATA